MSHLVSVIIPVYNRENELKRAINSVLNQTFQNFEIIVVDDFSEININSIVISFNDPRILYYKLDKKRNANVCRNLGLKYAKGNYIAMLDSDDEWLPNHLDIRINHIIETNADGVFGSYFLDDAKTKKIIHSRQFHHNETMANYLLSDGKAVTPSHFYKAECAKKILWDESLYRHQDYDFSIRFSEKFKFIPLDNATCIVHWLTSDCRTEHFQSQIDFIKKHKLKISSKNYHAYHCNVYKRIENRKDVALNIKLYFKNQQYNYIHDISYNEFLSIFNYPKFLPLRIYYRLKYTVKVFFKL